MQIKFTLLERELIGIGVYRTTYETNVEVKSNPAISLLKSQIKESIETNLGIRAEEAENDEAYTMGLIVRQSSSMGVRVPGKFFSLVITDKHSITRTPEEFRIQYTGE